MLSLKGSKIWVGVYVTPKEWVGGRPRSVPVPPCLRCAMYETGEKPYSDKVPVSVYLMRT